MTLPVVVEEERKIEAEHEPPQIILGILAEICPRRREQGAVDRIFSQGAKVDKHPT